MSRRPERAFYRRCGKRLLDLSIATTALVVSSPILCLLALLLLLTQGRPVLFRQTRPGLHGSPFTIYKLRTMTNERDATGALLTDRGRLTRIGAWLRRTSLDELPELWNVVRGEMSLVGPRPLLMAYLERYSASQMRRHDVRPGITGWAQVNGRNALSWEEKFELDLFYVDRVSPTLDLKILLKTVARVLTGHGVDAQGHATMPEFGGSGE